MAVPPSAVWIFRTGTPRSSVRPSAKSSNRTCTTPSFFPRKAQRGINGRAVLPILQFQVPLALFFPQRKPELPIGILGRPAGCVPHQELPVAVFDALIGGQALGAEQLAGPYTRRLLRWSSTRYGASVYFLV